MAEDAPGSSDARVTISQVAQRAKVSRTTAGFVLSGRRDQRISAATWQRVEAAAVELGYRPNLTARALRTGTTGTVAMISDHIATTSLANAMISGALRELRERDLLMFTVETLGEGALEHQVVAGLLGRQVDGFLYATMFTRAVQVPEMLRSRPVVLLNCLDTAGRVPSVVPDERGAGASAARAILAAGHHGPVHFVGTLPAGMTGMPQWHGATPLALDERLAGIGEVLEEAGVPLVTVDVENDWDVENGHGAVARLLDANSRPAALVCANDRVAVGAYRALGAAGLKVPGDVAVVSFDDSPAASLVTPPLTSIALPHEEMGRLAVRRLLDESLGHESPQSSHPQAGLVHRVPMTLVERGSVAGRS